MEQFATVCCGAGLYVPDKKYIKPEYHPTVVPWIQLIRALEPQVLDAYNDVNLNYGNIENLHQTRLWSIDNNHNFSEIKSEYTGYIFPLKQTQLFDGIGHSYQSAIDALRNKYGKYLVDDFVYEDHFVQYEIIEI